MYPISIEKWSADHRGGTKSYHTVLISTADNKALFINRYGKKGAWGSVTVTPFNDVGQAAGEFRTKRREKQGRGYTQDVASQCVTAEATDLANLKKLLGPQYWVALGAANAKHIDPNADTTGMKEPEVIEWEERPDGSFAKRERKPLAIDIPEPPPPPEPSIEQRRAVNPNWGLF